MAGVSPPRSGAASPMHTGEASTGIPADAAGVTGWLIERGAGLGFYAEGNLVSREDGAVADVAYSLNHGQKPVLTFTVEDSDPVRLIMGAFQWTGSSTEPKSWMHICVFLGDALVIPSIPSTAKQYDTKSLVRLPHDIDEVAAHMVRLLSHYSAPETTDTGEGVRRLTAATADWPKGRGNTRLSYKASTNLTGDGFGLFSAEDAEDGEAGTILRPSRKVVPLDFVGGGVSFEGALMRLVEAKPAQLLLSSEHRNYPFILHLTSPEGGGESTLDLWFDVEKSNIPQALEFWSLVEAVESSKALTIAGPSGELAALTSIRTAPHPGPSSA